MTVYLGTLGRLVKLLSTPSAEITSEDRHSFTTTLEGKRKSQVRPIGRRSWSLNAQFADRSEQAQIAQFANGAWGNGPFVFVSADAPTSNILTPEASTCTERNIAFALFENGGPWQVSPGVWVPNSYVSANPSNFMPLGDRYYPCIPGGDITGSAVLLGEGSKIGLFFWDANDALISGTYSSEAGSAAMAKRLSISMKVPANAVRCGLTASGASRGASPAITWTSDLRPWSDGQGCLKSVVSASSRELVLTGLNGTYSNVSYTVTEVG